MLEITGLGFRNLSDPSLDFAHEHGWRPDRPLSQLCAEPRHTPQINIPASGRSVQHALEGHLLVHMWEFGRKRQLFVCPGLRT